MATATGEGTTIADSDGGNEMKVDAASKTLLDNIVFAIIVRVSKKEGFAVAVIEGWVHYKLLKPRYKTLKKVLKALRKKQGQIKKKFLGGVHAKRKTQDIQR